MGIKYDRWNKDFNVRDLMVAHKLADLPPNLAEAVEFLVDPPLLILRKKGVNKASSMRILVQHTGKTEWQLQRTIEDIKDRTVKRFQRW